MVEYCFASCDPIFARIGALTRESASYIWRHLIHRSREDNTSAEWSFVHAVIRVGLVGSLYWEFGCTNGVRKRRLGRERFFLCFAFRSILSLMLVLALIPYHPLPSLLSLHHRCFSLLLATSAIATRRERLFCSQKRSRSFVHRGTSLLTHLTPPPVSPPQHTSYPLPPSFPLVSILRIQTSSAIKRLR